MACVKCGGTIAADARQCPHCGGGVPGEDPFVGKVLLDKYTVVRRIARGGSSSIYEAKTATGRAAIKVLHAVRGATRESAERLRREAVALRRIEHPSVVRVLDCGETPDGNPWIAMELLEGESLGALLDRVGVLPKTELLAILAPVCAALEEAHGKGVIHRDLKPQNIMLAQDKGVRVPKLLDFGIASLRDADSLTATETLSGTPMYMAPEQWEGLKHADARSDVYALGVIAYRALSGKFPFSADTALAFMKKSHLDLPIDLSIAVGERAVSSAACAAVMKALAKNPEERPQTPMEFLRALRPAPKAHRSGEPGRLWTAPRVAALVAALVACFLVGGAVGLYGSRLKGAPAPRTGPPTVVLMDTPAARGVYDPEAAARGATNADTLNDLLRDLPVDIQKETVPSTWNRETHVLGLDPDVIVIHRSAFFHGLNLEFGFGYEPFADERAKDRWRLLYRTADDKLISFFGFVAAANPRTRFLVYSRGTGSTLDGSGPCWASADCRRKWVVEAERRFPVLAGRITTMMIEGGVDRGTFKNPNVAGELRRNLQTILASR